MYWQADLECLPERLDDLGLGAAARQCGHALIKINMAREPLPTHPRTDARILGSLLAYISRCGAQSIVCESAEGHLRQNLVASGLGQEIGQNHVEVIDLDLEPAVEVESLGQRHYLPKLFYQHPVRIAVPCASQRARMLFSNNVKLFIGAVPRRYYQDDRNDGWRASIHEDLQRSVVAVFKAIMEHTPFRYFINGGNAHLEGRGSFALPLLVGDDATELDVYIAQQLFGIDLPEYLSRLQGDVTPGGSRGA